MKIVRSILDNFIVSGLSANEVAAVLVSLDFAAEHLNFVEPSEKLAMAAGVIEKLAKEWRTQLGALV